MAQQTINVGSALGDHTGDDGRTAFQKVNANFTELYGASGGLTIGGSNTQIQYNNAGALGGIPGFTFDGTTLTIPATVTFTAGSASANSWPKLPTGTLLTSAESGAIERDADTWYLTTDDGNRGQISGWHWIRQDSSRTLPNDTNENKLFDSVTNGTITLETGLYEFESIFSVTSMSATSGNALIDWLGAGTATIGTWLYIISGRDGTAANSGAWNGAIRTTQDSQASGVPASTGTEMCVWGRGTFEVTGAGTMIPSIALVTAAASSVTAGSFFRVRRIGSTSMVSVGQWS